MNWVVDERLKHQLIGSAILFLVAVILMPVLMHRAHDIYYHNRMLEVKPPIEKPHPKRDLNKVHEFKTKPVAHVDLQAAAPISPSPETLHTLAVIAKSSTQAASHKTTQMIAARKIKIAAKPILPHQSNVLFVKSKGKANLNAHPTKPSVMFSVQLGSFSNLVNAQALLVQLKRQGYVAAYQKVVINNVTMFKVTVGKVANRAQAQQLQARLAQTNRLNGIIVTTGVS